MITGPTPIEGIERMNTVVVRGSGQGVGTSPKQDLYVMEVDRGRNCYTCREFRHIAYYYRNRRRVMQGRRVKYRGGRIKKIKDMNNLKGVENLELLD